MILFADAADAEEPKAYKTIISPVPGRRHHRFSVIGLGTEKDKDGDLLKDIAARGGGRVFFSDRPDELPRLFAQDTFVVARSSFLEEPTKFKTVAGLSLLTNKEYAPPAMGGYNLCYLRPSANLAAVTLDEYKAPVVAAWQSGAGRVVCYTGEVDGKYTGPIAQWLDAGDFFTSLARWTAGKNESLPAGVALVQERRKGITSVKLHLDPDRKQDPFTAPPAVSACSAVPDAQPAVEKTRLAWTGPDTLAVELPVHGAETLLAAVDLPGHGKVALAPVCLPYSPEYEPGCRCEYAGDKKDGSESGAVQAQRRWSI